MTGLRTPHHRPAAGAMPWPPDEAALPHAAAPWFAPWRAPAEAVLQRLGAGADLPSALNATQCAPVHFVPQTALPPDTPYERYIFESKCVPTREGWHDFFNALVWARLPRAKQQLNALQAAQIVRDGVGAVRGPVRDAITVFDENAALLHAPDALWQALAARDWAALFGPLRPLWAEARLLVFGHAALEKLLAPYKSITVHVWRVAAPFDPAGHLDALDALLAADLTPAKLAAKPFAPLPLLGVPGWWADNQAPGFYDDPQVFRPRRAVVGAAA